MYVLLCISCNDSYNRLVSVLSNLFRLPSLVAMRRSMWEESVFPAGKQDGGLLK